MEVPTQTAEIFKILSKGQFINSNSPDKKIADLYKIIEDEQNFDNLYDYFLNINFVLERGNEYYYFSRPETKTDLEKKIEKEEGNLETLLYMQEKDVKLEQEAIR